MSSSHFVLSAICIGFVNTLSGWLMVGFSFHKYQGITPNTWRPEHTRSYFYSTLLSVLFGALFTLFYLKIGYNYVIAGNIWSHIKLGMICFACFNFISEIDNAIYINYDRRFVAGKIVASCISYMAASVIAGLFYWR